MGAKNIQQQDYGEFRPKTQVDRQANSAKEGEEDDDNKTMAWAGFEGSWKILFSMTGKNEKCVM